MKKLAFLLLLLPLTAFANGIDDKCPAHVVWGAPIAKETNVTYLCRMGYAVNYSNVRKTPVYVVEHLTRSRLVKNAVRADDFRPDPELAPEYRASLREYEGTVYDRGHMAPAGDFVYDKKAMSESFLLSNMVPQNRNHNRGIWKSAEGIQRYITEQSGDVYVVSGTIYMSANKTMMGSVSVPDSLYKIIVDIPNKRMIAFILPNREIPEKDLIKYVATVRNIEDITGINFFPKIPQKLGQLETVKGNLLEWVSKGPPF